MLGCGVNEAKGLSRTSIYKVRGCRWRRRSRFDAMAATAAASTSAPAPPPSSTEPAVHQLEVACAELKSLHESRAVYEKRGAIFFRTTVKAAAKSQLQELEKVKARAKKVSS